MKTVLFAAAVFFGFSLEAFAGVAAPVWYCQLDGTVDGTLSQIEALIFRGEDVVGHGTVDCTDAFSHRNRKLVFFRLSSAGLGPALNGRIEGIHIYVSRAGVAAMDGMIGEYEIGLAPRVGLMNWRAGVMGGVQVSGQGAGSGIDALIESRTSIGVDIGLTVLTIVPAKPAHWK